MAAVLRQDAARSLPPGCYSSALDRACEEAAHEVALQCEEYKQRHNDGYERAAGENLPIVATGTQEFAQLGGHDDLIVALAEKNQGDEQIVMRTKLCEQLRSRGDNWEILTSGAFISIIVPLLVFLALQRYFVRGLLAGSVKGG